MNSTHGYHCAILEAPEKVRELKPVWNELMNLHPQPEAFYDYPWIEACLHIEGATIFTPVVYSGQKIIGIMPLCLRGRRLEFIASSIADYNDMLCACDDGVSVLDCITNRLEKESGRWDAISLVNVRKDSLLYDAAWSGSNRAKWWFTETYVCPFIDLTHDKKQILAELSAKKSLVRHSKSLARAGKVTFRVLDDYGQVLPFVEDFCEQQVIRRVASGQSSALSTAQGRGQLDLLLRELSASKRLRFAVLFLDDKAIAYHYGFTHKCKYYWYKPSFDVDFWSYSPGEVLIRELLGTIGAEDVDIFDFTIGDEAFKSRFANKQSLTMTITRHQGWRVAVYGPARALKRLGVADLCSSSRRALHGCRRRADKLVSGWRAWRAGDVRIRSLAYARRQVLIYAKGMAVAKHVDWGAYQVKTLTPRELGRAILAGKTPYAMSGYSALFVRIRRGDHVDVVMNGNEIVHISWSGVVDTLHLDYEAGMKCDVPLPGPHLLIYDCWTHENYRGRGLYKKMLDEIQQRGRPGVQECVIYCKAENMASRAGIEGAEFKLRWSVSAKRYGGCINAIRIREQRES